MRIHDRLGNRESEPRSLNLAIRRARGAEEALEEMVALVRWNSDTRVADLDEDKIGLRSDLD